MALVVVVYLLSQLAQVQLAFVHLAFVAAGLVFCKEALATMARASKLTPQQVAWFEDLAALCSLFAAVFGAPAVVAGLIELANKQ
ncbi:hypothetical protein [Rathayibacter sp. AY2B5]|uniref:hypothetical protein n=1 Tax=Rathayibacter sp. AY2B5 TaxID=2080570 RepID=UPI000CE8C89F|nr:hypothetical protein [Rathayibacter sp. AY2B5]PPG37160.1 hypothetical protein C5C30_14205 [Rathayibacter sp. AY2B5]